MLIVPPPDELLRRDRERKRAWRYLCRGGVVIREEIGGAIGVRWARATRSGAALDPACLERWVQKGRLVAAGPSGTYRLADTNALAAHG